MTSKYNHYRDHNQPQQAPEGGGKHQAQDLTALVPPGEHRGEADQAEAPQTKHRGLSWLQLRPRHGPRGRRWQNIHCVPAKSVVGLRLCGGKHDGMFKLEKVSKLWMEYYY